MLLYLFILISHLFIFFLSPLLYRILIIFSLSQWRLCWEWSVWVCKDALEADSAGDASRHKPLRMGECAQNSTEEREHTMQKKGEQPHAFALLCISFSENTLLSANHVSVWCAHPLHLSPCCLFLPILASSLCLFFFVASVTHPVSDWGFSTASPSFLMNFPL